MERSCDDGLGGGGYLVSDGRGTPLDFLFSVYMAATSAYFKGRKASALDGAGNRITPFLIVSLVDGVHSLDAAVPLYNPKP